MVCRIRLVENALLQTQSQTKGKMRVGESPDKFRAVWTRDWPTGSSMLINNSPNAAISILQYKRRERSSPFCCLLPFGFTQLE